MRVTHRSVCRQRLRLGVVFEGSGAQFSIFRTFVLNADRISGSCFAVRAFLNFTYLYEYLRTSLHFRQ